MGQQGEARLVRLRQAVQRERLGGTHDLLGRIPPIQFFDSPRRSRASISLMRSTERLKPMARRSCSACPPVKLAAVMAMRRGCSWNRGTPSVRLRIGSSDGCAYRTGSRARRRLV